MNESNNITNCIPAQKKVLFCSPTIITFIFISLCFGSTSLTSSIAGNSSAPWEINWEKWEAGKREPGDVIVLFVSKSEKYAVKATLIEDDVDAKGEAIKPLVLLSLFGPLSIDQRQLPPDLELERQSTHTLKFASVCCYNVMVWDNGQIHLTEGGENLVKAFEKFNEWADKAVSNKVTDFKKALPFIENSYFEVRLDGSPHLSHVSSSLNDALGISELTVEEVGFSQYVLKPAQIQSLAAAIAKRKKELNTEQNKREELFK